VTKDNEVIVDMTIAIILPDQLQIAGLERPRDFV
jgi:hypothetical protein